MSEKKLLESMAVEEKCEWIPTHFGGTFSFFSWQNAKASHDDFRVEIKKKKKLQKYDKLLKQFHHRAALDSWIS